MNTFQTLTITARAPGVAQVTMSRAQVFNAFDGGLLAREAWLAFGNRRWISP
jgi:hypothetical protein